MIYVEIRVKGQLDENWSEWFHGLRVSHIEGQQTALCGPVTDQSELYGLLARLGHLGLELVCVTCLEAGQNHPL